MTQNRKFGFWTLTFLVVGNMIGAGVFTTSGYSLRDLHSPSLVVAAWIVGGLIAVAGATSYGQLAKLMPESGGEYLFLTRAAHPFFGCIAGWVSLIAGFTGPIAFAATAFESYALPNSVRPAWFREDMLACGVVLMCLAWHSVHPRFGQMGQNFVVMLKLVMLIVFLVIAGLTIGPNRWQGTNTAVADPRTTWQIILAFASSLVWISLSYSGFNAAVYVADEVDNPKTISRALIVATMTVAIFYVLLNSVFVFAPPRELIIGEVEVAKEIAAVAAQWIGGSSLALLVRTTIAVALFTSVSSMMLSAPRVYAKMADDGVMPGWMSFAEGHPRAAMVAQAILAIVVVLNSTLAELLNYLSLTLSISAAGTVACLFAPSVRGASIWRVSSIAPLIFVAATSVSAILSAINSPKSIIATAATFAIGAIGYAFVRHRGG